MAQSITGWIFFYASIRLCNDIIDLPSLSIYVMVYIHDVTTTVSKIKGGHVGGPARPLLRSWLSSPLCLARSTLTIQCNLRPSLDHTI